MNTKHILVKWQALICQQTPIVAYLRIQKPNPFTKVQLKKMELFLSYPDYLRNVPFVGPKPKQAT